MLDIVGNIRIDERKPERLRYLLACLHSYEFLRDRVNFFLNLDSASFTTYDKVADKLDKLGFNYTLNTVSGNYGNVYCGLLQKGKNPFVLNFFEDHFMIMDSEYELEEMLNLMGYYKVHILKNSFFAIEQNSAKNLIPIDNNDSGKIFVNDRDNFIRYQKHYGKRYFIGVNTIMERKFCTNFWNRKLTTMRPHEFEIVNFDSQ